MRDRPGIFRSWREALLCAAVWLLLPTLCWIAIAALLVVIL